MVIKFKNNGELKGRANMLYDGIKIQNDSDKAEHTPIKWNYQTRYD